VRVIGAVNEPGVKRLPRGSSYLLPALVAAGNLTENASPNLEIIHCGPGRSPDSKPPAQVADGFRTELTSFSQPGAEPPTSVQVNLASVTKTGQADYYLADQDVVIVHEREPRSVYVMGLVRKPDAYELPPDKDVRVLEALAMAGGRTWEVADKVWVIRQRGPDGEPARIEVDVRKAKQDGSENLRLMAGDVVTVEETPLTFTLDFLKNFIRLGASLPLY
jgi:protein involved in polysaccharide export with SLBB domain